MVMLRGSLESASTEMPPASVVAHVDIFPPHVQSMPEVRLPSDGLLTEYVDRLADFHSAPQLTESDRTRIQGEVGSWLSSSGILELTPDARLAALSGHLYRRYGGLVWTSELAASELAVKYARTFVSEQSEGKRPVDAALGIGPDLSTALPSLEYVPPRLRDEMISGLFPESLTLSTAAPEPIEVTNATKVSDHHGFWGRMLARTGLGFLRNRVNKLVPGQDAVVETVALAPAEALIDRQERLSTDSRLRITYPVETQSTESALIVKDFLANRLTFVKGMGWTPEAVTDEDRYDVDPSTAYILRSDAENTSTFIAGMRLTEVDSLENSLSWHMLDGAPEIKEAARNNEAEFARILAAQERGELWDLTRLVPALDGRLMSTPSAMKDSILDIIGGGMRLTAQGEGTDPAWVFVTTPTMLKFLTKIGVRTTTLATGKVSFHDNQVSHLCVAYPRYALDTVRDSTLPSADAKP